MSLSDEEGDLESWGWTDLCVSYICSLSSLSSLFFLRCVEVVPFRNRVTRLLTLPMCRQCLTTLAVRRCPVLVCVRKIQGLVFKAVIRPLSVLTALPITQPQFGKLGLA